MKFGILAWTISLQHPFKNLQMKKRDTKYKYSLILLIVIATCWVMVKIKVAIPLKCGLKHTY